MPVSPAIVVIDDDQDSLQSLHSALDRRYVVSNEEHRTAKEERSVYQRRAA